MKERPSTNYLLIDLTEAVVLYRFLAFCRRWLSWSMIAGAAWTALYAPVHGIALVAITAVPYLVVCYPRRRSLLAWVCLLLVLAPVMALCGLLKFADSLGKDFTLALLIPICVVVITFWVSWRVLRQPAAMTDRPDDSGFITMGIGGNHGARSKPSFLDTWFSGGWRSTFPLAFAWTVAITLMGAKALPSCFYLALSLLSALVIPWVLLPVWRSLHNEFALPLINQISDNQASRGNVSYRLFVIRRALRRPLALAWFMLSALFVATAFFCVLPVEATELRQFLPSIALVCLAVSAFCLRLARRLALQNSVSGEVADTDDFTLYLRSFLDDQAEVLRDGLLFRVWLVDPFLRVLRFERFEEVLAKAVWPFGKLLALNRPGEGLPQLGALRIDVAGGDWQEIVEALIRRAKNLLMTVGFTSGLGWEFRRLAESVDLARLSLVVPPAMSESILSTWDLFASNWPKLLSCPEEVLARTLAVRFTPEEGLPIFLTARRSSAAAYQLALNTCWLPLRTLALTRSETLGSSSRVAYGAQTSVSSFSHQISLSKLSEPVFRKTPLVKWLGKTKAASFVVAIALAAFGGHYLISALSSFRLSTGHYLNSALSSFRLSTGHYLNSAPNYVTTPPSPAIPFEPPPPPPPPPPPIGPELRSFAFTFKVSRFFLADQVCTDRFNESAKQLAEGKLSTANFEAILQDELLPALDSQREIFSKLHDLDPVNRPLAKDVLRYISVRKEGWELLLTGLREDNPELVKAAREHELSLKRLAARIGAEYKAAVHLKQAVPWSEQWGATND